MVVGGWAGPQGERVSAPELSPKGSKTPAAAVTTAHSQHREPGKPRQAGFFSHIPWDELDSYMSRAWRSPVQVASHPGSLHVLSYKGAVGPVLLSFIKE